MALRQLAMTLQAGSRKQYQADRAYHRLDQFLVDQDTGQTRSQIQRLISQGHVAVNGHPAKPSQRVHAGDWVSVTVPPPRKVDLVPQWLPITVVYQDADVAVIDKPAGLSVHPGPGHPDGTLVNAMLALCPDLRGISGDLRPGIVHRLDKDTSGLMVVAKTHQSHQELSEQIKDREVTKGYLALAVGQLYPEQGVIEAPIGRDPRNRKRMAVTVGGREARTNYRVLERIDGYSLLELYLETGRTHQIRVHLAYLGHPILGDRVYGKTSAVLARQFLHAHHLGFRHPNGGEPVDFHAGLPEELASVLSDLKEGAERSETRNMLQLSPTSRG